MGRCNVYTRVRLLLLTHPFISLFFFLSNFQTLKVFVTLFLGTLRPRRLTLGTHVDSRQMYRVYQTQAAAAYLSLNFSYFFHSNFQTLKFFVTLYSGNVRRRRLKFGTHLDSGGVSWIGCIVYTRIMRLLLFVPLFFHFSFASILKD